MMDTLLNQLCNREEPTLVFVGEHHANPHPKVFCRNLIFGLQRNGIECGFYPEALDIESPRNEKTNLPYGGVIGYNFRAYEDLFITLLENNIPLHPIDGYKYGHAERSRFWAENIDAGSEKIKVVLAGNYHIDTKDHQKNPQWNIELGDLVKRYPRENSVIIPYRVPYVYPFHQRVKLMRSNNPSYDYALTPEE